MTPTPGDHVHPSPDRRGLDRRRFLTLGGASVLASAVLAACGSSKKSSAASSAASTTTSTAAPTTNDINLLRTASSLEEAAAAGYQKIIDAKVVTSTAMSNAVSAFQTHHKQHSQLFQNATSAAGGKPFTTANPVVMDQLLTPRLAAVKTEADAVKLLYDLEHMLSASFQADVGLFNDVSFNRKVMSVGGIEAGHVAFFAPSVAKPTTPDGAFQSIQGAVPPSSIS